MKKFLLSFILALCASLYANAYMVRFHVNGAVVDSIVIGDGEYFDPRQYASNYQTSLEKMPGSSFYGWSTVNDPNNPVIFRADTIQSDKHLYAMYYGWKDNDIAQPILSAAELAEAIAKGDSIYIGIQRYDQVFFISDPYDHNDNYGYRYYAGCLTLSNDSYTYIDDETGVIDGFSNWNKVFHVFRGDSISGYKLSYQSYDYCLHEDEMSNGQPVMAAHVGDTIMTWSIAFGENGSVKMTQDDYTLVLEYNSVSGSSCFAGKTEVSEQDYTVRLYRIKSGADHYTNGYHKVEMKSDPNLALHYNYFAPSSAVEYSFENDALSLYVANGATVRIDHNADAFLLGFDHWSSSDSVYNGATTNVLSVSPTQDMTLEAVYAMKYWKVELVDLPDSTHIDTYITDESGDWMDDLYQMGSEWDSVQVEHSYIYIKKGETLPLTFVYDNDGRMIDHWISSDAAVNGSEDDPLYLTPTGDMTLSVVTRPITYWTISLPDMNVLDTTTMILPVEYIQGYLIIQNDPIPVEPLKSPRRMPIDEPYIFDSEWCGDNEPEDCLNHFCKVIKGKSVKLSAFLPVISNNYRFDHWVSSDSTVNGRTEAILNVTPTKDMTLSCVLKEAGVQTVINGDTIVYSDTITATVDVYGDGSVQLTLQNEDGLSEITLDEANVSGDGLVSELKDLVLTIVANSTVSTEEVGIRFEGASLSIVSDDSAMITVEANLPLVGNGLNTLFINARIIIRSTRNGNTGAPARHLPAGPLQPALSGFADVTLGANIELCEVWYDDRKGNPLNCRYNAAQQAYGEVDIETQSFTPATSLVFADGNFYVDYIDGKIDVPTGLKLYKDTEAAQDMRCFDILGREILEPQHGIFIRGGRVYLR